MQPPLGLNRRFTVKGSAAQRDVRQQGNVVSLLFRSTSTKRACSLMKRWYHSSTLHCSSAAMARPTVGAGKVRFSSRFAMISGPEILPLLKQKDLAGAKSFSFRTHSRNRSEMHSGNASECPWTRQSSMSGTHGRYPA